MFRIIVLLINAAVLIFLITMTVIETPDEFEELFFVSLFYIAVITNLYFAYTCSGSAQFNDGWLSLYFQRKRLEEKNKIERLKKEASSL
jgi:hypothetical protein